MPCAILVNHCSNTYTDKAKAIAEQLQFPLLHTLSPDYDCYLIYEGDRLGCLIPSIAQKPYFVDFLSDKLSFRQQQTKKELIVKACHIKGLNRPIKIMDATAGFGRDSFILAASGAAVTMLERNLLVANLLDDGLTRFVNYQSENAGHALQLDLITDNAIDYFSRLTEANCPDVIYLDPMFEEERNAKVKKDLQILQWLLAKDAMDADTLFQSAYATKAKRIVVKRAIHAPVLGKQKPSFSFNGKHTRFDVYCR